MMKNKHFLLSVLLSFALCGNALADDDRPRGFLFYDDKQLPTIEPTRKKPKEPKKVIVGGGGIGNGKAKVSGSPIVAQTTTKPELEPFSVEWLRAKMPILLDRAMNNPTEENVRAYKYAERMMLDMASNYAAMSQQVVQNDPMLDESVRFPLSSMARNSALYQIDKAKEAIIQDLASKGGIWYFFDTQCRFCESQFKAIKLLEEKYGIETRYISLDGGIFQNMDRRKVLFDKGGERARMLGIQLTPATVLVLPPDRSALVSHGASSLDNLEEKLVTAAVDMNVAPPELVNVAEMQKRGVLTTQDLQQVKQKMKNPDDPDELVRMMNEAIRRKM